MNITKDMDEPDNIDINVPFHDIIRFKPELYVIF